MRYAGKQSSRVAAEPASGPAPTAACPTVANGPASSPAEIEQAVAAQGETVRQLKASKAAKPLAVKKAAGGKVAAKMATAAPATKA